MRLLLLRVENVPAVHSGPPSPSRGAPRPAFSRGATRQGPCWRAGHHYRTFRPVRNTRRNWATRGGPGIRSCQNVRGFRRPAVLPSTDSSAKTLRCSRALLRGALLGSLIRALLGQALCHRSRGTDTRGEGRPSIRVLSLKRDPCPPRLPACPAPGFISALGGPRVPPSRDLCRAVGGGTCLCSAESAATSGRRHGHSAATSAHRSVRRQRTPETRRQDPQVRPSGTPAHGGMG